ncbi:MAG: tartrate dehydrogenase [Armatimonadetes bacterium]|nr:tartrate dehydrogenase [Armatimonadota bacterium]
MTLHLSPNTQHPTPLPEVSLKEYNIALYPGDGIGTEVTEEAVKVLRALERLYGNFKINLTEFDWSARYWRKTGKIVPDDYLDILKEFDAIMLGAVGHPALIPDHISLAPLIEIRQGFDQYVGLRPARLLPGITSPLAGKSFGDIDLIVVRENSEGEYVDLGGRFKVGKEDEVNVQTALHTRKGVERILRFGFELARKRGKHLTMATKSNILKYGMVFWDSVLADLSPEYSDVAVDKYHVDALTMNFVRWPEKYDVVVASNLFGDILSDLAGVITGSLGLAPSGCINPERDYPSLFEPVHGSAPDIAGRGIANPIAAIRSAAMMMDFLGESEAAERVEQAVIESLADGSVRTPDIGGSATTAEVGDDIAKRVERAKKRE